MTNSDKNKQSFSLLEYLLTNHRGAFATIFLLPLSVCYNWYFTLRNKLVFFLRSAPNKHEERVNLIMQQLAQWKADGANEKICTSRSAWLTMSELVPQYKSDRRKIEVNLRDILKINTQEGTVHVEPLVNMGQITATLLPLGWTLEVLPELDDLTVGGLIMGFGIESSSHKYGLFQHICHSFEIITAEGKRLRCSKEENAELFYIIPWSHGTLGILASAELKIIPAQKYVRIQYRPLYGLDKIVSEFEKESRNTEKNDFVECLQYGKDKAVLMTANFASSVKQDGILNSIGRWYKPWFYKHAEGYLAKPEGGIEYVPLRQYYHRHTRSLFWEMSDIIPFGNKPLFRMLLGWALPPRISLMKYFETKTTKELREKYHVVQDMLMPIKKLKVSLIHFDEQYSVYPLWLSPMCIYKNDMNLGFVHPYAENDEVDELFVDIGAYGTPKKANFDGNQALHDLEQFVIEHHGYQALYARTLLSKDNFKKMFDHTHYDLLRQKLPLCQEAFGEVYEKVSGRVAPSNFKNKSTS